ncbi:LCP family protein [Agreia sp. Leaf335]|uniref:LCP family protein n=1 Tax=Agreia sp. Leaf335 TaxID=1736340 RepID=UPI00138EDF44|nr:LCP family protein [Agreia sp. Leaf335]
MPPTNTNPRHARRHGGRPVLSILIVVGMTLAVALVGATSVAAIAGFSLAKKVEANSIEILDDDEQAPPSIGEYSGAFNILIVGVDNDSEQGDAYGERGSTLNDVNLMLHVSADHSNAVAVSFPRDLIVDHPTCTGPDGAEYSEAYGEPINIAMGRGGLACVVRTVEQLTGLNVPYAGQVSFDAVVQMTDAIGGVTICLTDSFDDPWIPLALPAGYSEISGASALGFLRSRHGVGDGSDLGRISSQQQYLSSLMRKIKSDETLTDLSKLYSLANVVATNVRLSSTLTSADTMISMAQALRTIDLDNIVFVQYPGSTGDSNYPGKVVPLSDQADELFALIASDQPFTLGADSQGIGTVADPSVTAPVDPAVPAEEPSAPDSTESEAPAGVDSVVLDGVTGQTAQQATCAIPN